MKLRGLKLTNVFSFVSADVLLNERGLVLVTGECHGRGGSNGAGKSSLVSRALSFGLYGASVDDVRADDVVNRFHKDKKASVEIHFEDKGYEYRIIRQRNPAKLTFLGRTIKAVEWQDLSHRLETETQTHINNVLGRSFSTFCHADVFGQGRNKNFLHLSSKDQREIIEEILPIGIIDKWAETSKKAYQSLTNKFSTLEGEIHTQKARWEDAIASKQQLHTSFNQWEKSRQVEIFKIKKDIARVAESEKQYTIRWEGIKVQLDALGPPESLPDTNSIREKRDQVNTELNTASLRRNSEKFKIKEIEEEICPTCGQEVQKEFTDKLIADQEALHKSISLADTAISILANKVSDYESEITSTLEVIKVVSDRNAQRDTYTAQLEAMEAVQVPSGMELNSKCTQKYEEINPVEEPLRQVTEKVTILSMELDKTRESMKKVEKDKGPVGIWNTAFKKDIKNALFKKVCKFLNVRIAWHLSELNNSHLHAEFATLKELKSGESRDGLNVRCWNDEGGENFSSLSGGEKQMISFATGMALADLAESQSESHCNVMVLDEPFLYLDNRNCENIVNYLTGSLSKTRSTIFLISNEDSLKALIPNTIHVIKKDGISSVV